MRLAALFAAKVNGVIEDFEQSGSGGIQAIGAELRELILEAKLAAYVDIHHSHLCPHEDN